LSLPWQVDNDAGPAAQLLVPTAARGRTVRFLAPDAAAVVLGSTQPESDIDRARAARVGIDVVRRRSGGGAVLVGPGRLLWVEVIIPASDPLWTADVGRAFWWMGDVWAAALATAGFDRGEVWRGALVRSPWSDRICFAGRGPGEVTVGGAKVLGLSQRRTRTHTQFQCAALITWDPSELLAVMALDDDVRIEAGRALTGAAVGVGVDVASRLAAALIEHLP
jgi:lipoate-protein ligase A